VIGRCDNCGHRGRVHRWDRRYWVCDACTEKLAKARAQVERFFNRRRAA
jgi:ribosomal protein L37AE/L43A